MQNLLLLFLLKLEWSDFWDVSYVVIGFILGASAVITAVVVIWSKAIRPFYEKWIKPIQEVEPKRSEILSKIDLMQTQQNTISEAVAAISKELKTNGGESLKDAILRVEDKQDYSIAKLKLRDQVSPNPVLEIDGGGRCTFANRALCTALDVDENELLDRRWLAKLAVEDKVHVLQSWLDAAENKIPITDIYTFLVNGEKRQAQIRGEPALNRKGELVGFMCLVDFK